MKTMKEKMQLRLLCRISMNLNMFFNLCWIWSKKTSVSSFHKENNFKQCLTKQLLNMFKLWCEWGTRSYFKGMAWKGFSFMSKLHYRQVVLAKVLSWNSWSHPYRKLTNPTGSLTTITGNGHTCMKEGEVQMSSSRHDSTRVDMTRYF